LTSKSKLIEAAFKEKDFDAYFSLGMVLQGARQIFINEISKNIEVFSELCDNSNCVLVIKKTFKSLLENHNLRKLKISKESKI